jgi:uncharacterized protein (TIGR04222 family)
MPLNPLDWTASPFLTLYVATLAIVVVLAVRHRIAVSAGSSVLAAPISDPVELGWLSGGRQRAADTVLVAFLESGAAIQGRRGRLTIDLSHALPARFARFTHSMSGVGSVAAFRRAIKSALDDVGTALSARGLIPDPAAVVWLQRRTWLLLLIPLSLGAAKCWIGEARGKPIGFLVLLLVLTLAIGLLLSAFAPYRTRAGRKAAREELRRRARAARAPQGAEMVLAFALSGAAVLAGRPYADLLRTNGGSGCSGSGCSGGDGGGGGCGGCGGGGC